MGQSSTESSVILSVTALGSGPFTYQWFKNNSLIIGANSSTHTVNSSTDPSTPYVVRVTDANGNHFFSDRAVVTFYSAPPPPPTAPSIASVSPSTLPPSFSTQLINIYGSNFKAAGDPNASKLIFRDPANIAYVRTPIFVSSSQLQYNITVQSAVGTWSVTVTNASQSPSNFRTFLVETPPPNTGWLTVTLQPAAAVSAGAQWQVDGGAYRNSGDTATGLSSGSHTIACKAVSGYTAPASHSVSITGGAGANDTETYSAVAPSTYTLTIISDGSRGTVYPSPNRNQFSPGETVRLTAYNQSGWHFDHWSGAASGTENHVALVMNSDKTVTANWAAGDWSIGAINVTIQPSGAVAAGARWKADGGSWQNSGVPLSNAYIGDHYLEFNNVPGWNKAAARCATVIGGQTTNVVATYTQDTAPGTLIVTLMPPDAVAAGARWRVNGGAPQNSGASLSLAAGTGYSVTFDSASGWTAPSAQTVGVLNGQTTLATGNYAPPAGQPVIVSISPPTGPLAGGTGLTIDGVNFAAPATVLVGGRLASNVVVLSVSQIVCLTPSNAVYGTQPVVVQTTGGNATNLNGFVYATTRGTNIDLVGSIGGRVDAVAVSGNYAYLGEGSSLLVLNVSNPSTPFPVGRQTLPGIAGDVGLFTQGGRTYACVAARDSGLYVVDVTTPSSPALKGYYKTPGFCYGVAVLGGFEYVADGPSGLEIFDLANPSAPALVSAAPQAGFAKEIVVKATGNGVFAYLATYSGLRIVEVSDPHAPLVRGFVDFGVSILSIGVAGNRAYLTAQGYGQMADISNPDNPTNLGQFDSGFAFAETIQGTTLYTAGSAGFHIYDLGTGTPQEIGSLPSLTADGFNLFVTNNRAYVVGGDRGLTIVSVSTPSAPSQAGSYMLGSGQYQGVAKDGHGRVHRVRERRGQHFRCQ